MKQKPPFSQVISSLTHRRARARAHTHTHTHTHMHANPHNAYTGHPLRSRAQRLTHRRAEAQTPGLSKRLLPPPDSCALPTIKPSNSPTEKRSGPTSLRELLNLVGWCHLMVRMRNAPLVPRSRRIGKGPGSLCSPLSLQQGYIQSSLRRMRLSLIFETFQTRISFHDAPNMDLLFQRSVYCH